MNYSAFHWSEKARKYAETLGTIFNVKGRVNTVADLPSTGNKIGDVWLVGLTTDTDLSEYAWLSFDNVTRWEKLGSTATSIAFSALTGSPNDNVALKNALDGKYDASNPNGYTSNTATGTNSITILGNASSSNQAVNIGYDSWAASDDTCAIGYRACATGHGTTSIGYNCFLGNNLEERTAVGANVSANAKGATLIGYNSGVLGVGAIQLGARGSNSEAGTFKVSLSTDGITYTNYKLLGSTGLVPPERHASVSNTAGDYFAKINVDGQGNVTQSWGEVNSNNISKWSSNVTNCITDIPQDIKLELDSGTLTLKAGSKCYLKTDTTTPSVSIASDLTTTQTTNGTYFAIYNGSSLTTILTTAYDYSTLPDTYSYPLALVTVSDNTISSIDQVFNGFGYIGSTVFALPGMSGLVADGKNSDGTYKSIPVTISSVQTVTIASNISANNARFLITDSGSLSARIGTYDKINNYVLGSDGSRLSCFIIADSCSVTSGVINTFNRKQVFHALDWNDSYDISGLGMPSDKHINLTLGASGTRYTAPANGYFYVNKQSGGTNLYMVLTNETSGFNVGTVYAVNAQFRTHIAVRKGDVVKVDYSMTGTTNGFVFFYAEGEVNV